ncbi:MAG TPA: hypothetical protein VFH78_10665 [Candidatus Thermoplasmatota archaeon]|nr:hypothetical protein [Candidatus Thermoplasmatota archaeon]
MKLTKLTAIALAAIGMTALATATHSASPCNAEITEIGAGAATLYIVNDGFTTATWIYLETNGHPGVQRGGMAWYETGLGTGVDDDCWDRDLVSNQLIEDPDMILY